jgi:hypothetical protein
VKPIKEIQELLDKSNDEDNEYDELSQIFWANECGPDSWVIYGQRRWVYLSDGMYISEFGDMKDL